MNLQVKLSTEFLPPDPNQPGSVLDVSPRSKWYKIDDKRKNVFKVFHTCTCVLQIKIENVGVQEVANTLLKNWDILYDQCLVFSQPSIRELDCFYWRILTADGSAYPSGIPNSLQVGASLSLREKLYFFHDVDGDDVAFMKTSNDRMFRFKQQESLLVRFEHPDSNSSELELEHFGNFGDR